MSEDVEALVCGAGPVGLLLGTLLGQAGIETLVIDRRRDIPERSMAIGIMPPSLGILASIDLATAIQAAAIPVRAVRISDAAGCIGSLGLDRLGGPFPHICSLPQRDTMRLLQTRLQEQAGVTLQLGVELQTARDLGDRVQAQLATPSGLRSLSARHLFGCDGSHGRSRELIDTEATEQDLGADFLMADFPDPHGPPQTAQLFFTSQGSVEAFPLPGGRRRWIIQTLHGEDDEQALVKRVHERCGLRLSAAQARDLSAFHPRRRIARRYGQGRIVLCGDAAHEITPIGGQGMNLGLADAEFLAAAMAQVHSGRLATGTAVRAYQHHRRASCLAAARRAEWGMWLGTRSGHRASRVRTACLRHLLLRGPLARRLPAWAAMQTLPAGRYRPDMLPSA